MTNSTSPELHVAQVKHDKPPPPRGTQSNRFDSRAHIETKFAGKTAWNRTGEVVLVVSLVQNDTLTFSVIWLVCKPLVTPKPEC